ncbi:defensin-like protein 183 [Eutrema salsugineum]|nr:defensin-like protein 183 [Eutrema salsugineum]
MKKALSFVVFIIFSTMLASAENKAKVNIAQVSLGPGLVRPPPPYRGVGQAGFCNTHCGVQCCIQRCAQKYTGGCGHCDEIG